MKVSRGAASVALSIGFLSVCSAFLPSSTKHARFVAKECLYAQEQDVQSSTATFPMRNDQEKFLRQELTDRNSIVLNEEKYAVADGAGLEVPPATVENGLDRNVKDNTARKESAAESSIPTDNSTTSTGQSRTDLENKINKATKARPYALFLAEKGAEILEDILPQASTNTDPRFDGTNIGNAAPKERVVVLGTGWGAASFLKDIDCNQYDVTVISPRNYFLFTPMLAGASVGTVEFRSITEPVREINRKANYLEAIATEIDPESNLITCQSVVCDGNSCDIEEFTVNYDRLVVTIGAQTNTFGIPGVREYCCFLKQVEDARRIRTAIVNCFERANLPNLTDEQRKKDLTFAIIGAGPTGIEFAAELRDFIEQDGPKYYPDLLKHVRIKVIEASSTVLAPFDKTLQQEAIDQMNRAVRITDEEVRKLVPERFKLTELLLDASVKEVTEKKILLNDGNEVSYGLAVWAAGNGPLPLTLQLIDVLGTEQANQQPVARGRLGIDQWMRVHGGDGRVFAFGDCTCITEGQLPATAQVASQQGEYLARLMNKKYDFSPPRTEEGLFLPPLKQPNTSQSLSDIIAAVATGNYEYAKPFQFLNLGILAYTGGGSALAQVATTPNGPLVKGTGKVGNALWRSVYVSKQISWRNRLLVLNDWASRRIFGRDITRI